MGKEKYILRLLLYLSVSGIAFGEQTFNTLLQKRIEKDNAYAIALLEKKTAQNNAKTIRLNTVAAGSFALNNGAVMFNTDRVKRGFSVTPTMNVHFPLYNALRFSFAAPYKKIGTNESVGVNLDLSGDIYSAARQKALLRIEQSEYAVVQADLKCREQKNRVRQTLLKDLKELGSMYAHVTEKQTQLLQTKINITQLKIQGFADNSIRIRTENLSLIRMQRALQEAEFNLYTQYHLFNEDDSTDIAVEQIHRFLYHVIQSLDEPTLINPEKLMIDQFKPFAAAQSSYRVNNLERKINRHSVSLKGNAGYSWNMTKTGSAGSDSTHVIQAGLGIRFPGGEFNTGVQLPLLQPQNSTLTFSLSIDPFAMISWKTAGVTSELQNTIEGTRLTVIEDEFKKTIKTYVQRKQRLEWEYELNNTELPIYQKNEADHAAWLSKGIITQAEFEKAHTGTQAADLRVLLLRIDQLLFNLELENLFLIHESV